METNNIKQVPRIEDGKIFLSEEYKRRIRKEIKEVTIIINKELAYSADHRNYFRIDDLKKHIERLEKAIKNGFIEITKN